MKNRKTVSLALVLAAMMTASALAATVYAADLPEAGATYETVTADGGEAAPSGEQETAGAAGEAAPGKRGDGEQSRPSKRKPGKGGETAGDGTEAAAEGVKKEKKKKDSAAEPEGAIGKDAAKEIALADAGIEAEGKVLARYKEEDGVGFYKVKFKSGGQTFRYRIDAMTGAVLEKTAG